MYRENCSPSHSPPGASPLPRQQARARPWALPLRRALRKTKWKTALRAQSVTANLEIRCRLGRKKTFSVLFGSVGTSVTLVMRTKTDTPAASWHGIMALKIRIMHGKSVQQLTQPTRAIGLVASKPRGRRLCGSVLDLSVNWSTVFWWSAGPGTTGPADLEGAASLVVLFLVTCICACGFLGCILRVPLENCCLQIRSDIDQTSRQLLLSATCISISIGVTEKPLFQRTLAQLMTQGPSNVWKFPITQCSLWWLSHSICSGPIWCCSKQEKIRFLRDSTWLLKLSKSSPVWVTWSTKQWTKMPQDQGRWHWWCWRACLNWWWSVTSRTPYAWSAARRRRRRRRRRCGCKSVMGVKEEEDGVDGGTVEEGGCICGAA